MVIHVLPIVLTIKHGMVFMFGACIIVTSRYIFIIMFGAKPNHNRLNTYMSTKVNKAHSTLIYYSIL